MSSADNKRIAKNSLYMYVRLAISMVVSLYTSRVVLNALGFTDFGIYGLVGGIVSVFVSINGALSGATARYITVELGHGNEEKIRKAFSTAAILHIILSGVIIIACETIGLWFLNYVLDIPSERMGAANWVLQFSIMTAVLSFTQVPYTADMIAHEKMSAYAFVGLLQSFGNLGVAFLISQEPFDRLVWYAFLVFVVNLIVIIVSRAYCIRHFPESRIKIYKDIKLYKEMMSYTGYSIWVNIAWLAQNQGVNFVLNIFFGPILNTAQAIGQRIYGALEQFYLGFGTAIKPRVFKLYAQGQMAEMWKLVIHGASMSYMVVLILLVPLTVNINEVLRIWLGEYPAETPAICVCLMGTELFAVVGNTRLMLFQASGHIKEFSLLNGTILMITLPVSWIMFKIGLPPVSAFICVFMTSFVSDIASLLNLRRFIPYSAMGFYRAVQLPCICYTILTLGCSYFAKIMCKSNMIGLIVSTVVSSIMIITYVWFRVLTPGQRSDIKRKLRIK